MHTDACEATTVRGEQSAEVMDRRIACLHDARMHLHAALGVLADADANVVKRAHDLVADLPDVAACADVEALLADVAPPMPEQAAEVDAARALVAEAHAVTKAGRPREAAEILEGVFEQAAEIGYTPLVVDAEYELGMTRLTLGEAEAAEQVLTSALRAAIAGGQWSTAASVAVRIVYSVGLMQHRLAEAKTLTSVAWGLVERGGDATDELDLRMALALTLQEEGKYAEATQELRSLLARAEQIVGSDHPVVALAHMNLGNLHGMQGQLGDAEVEHQHVLEIRERTVGPDHPQTADARLGLGNVYFLQGRFERAEAAYERVRVVWEAAYGLENADVAMVYSNLGNLFRHQERWEEAERATVQALEIRERVHGLDAPETADSLDNVAALHASRRRWGEAAASFRRALEIRRKVFGAEHPRVALSLVNLAQVQAESRPGPEAVRMAEEALAMSERVQASPAEVGRALFVLAEAVWDAEHDVTRARELVLRAREAYAAGDGGDLHALEALARELGDG
jgi:tetratricopeptide (TPR) repeat protein